MATMRSSLNGLPSPATVYAAYASLSSTFMLLRTTYYQVVPRRVEKFVISVLSSFFSSSLKDRISEIFGGNSVLTLVIERSGDGPGPYQNNLYKSFQIYMSTKSTPRTNRLKITTISNKSNKLITKLAMPETVTQVYQGVTITLAYISKQSKDDDDFDYNSIISMGSWFELRFDKIHKDLVMNSYIPFVLKQACTVELANRDLKLHTYQSSWSAVNLEHSSTFETLAMEPSEKKDLMDDLDLFLKRRDFFKRVGRAWKRGYLLYGPPGTGKSSLVAAMANYLKFDIYDLQLMNVNSDCLLRNLLMGIANRSILVIEDIDCSVDLPGRNTLEKNARYRSNKFSLSGLLNFIDGIWSSCGEERIIIFTTNNKDKLDPALLRPGRMDKHIHMSYLTINGFKTLASTYLEIKHDHWRFAEIEELLRSVQVTPAEVAEELMRACDADVCLEGLVHFLKEKKRKGASVESKDGEDTTFKVESKDGDVLSSKLKDEPDFKLQNESDTDEESNTSDDEFSDEDVKGDYTAPGTSRERMMKN